MHCKLGKALSRSGEIGRCHGRARVAIRLAPGNVDAHKILGDILASQGKIDEATAEYLQTDRLKSDANITLTDLKKSGFTGEMPAADPGADDDAIAATSASAIAPSAGPRSRGWLLPNRGIALSQKKEYDKAWADLNEAIRLDPKLATAYVIRGEIWLKKNDLDHAIADLSEAVRIDPHSPAYNARGFAWANRRQFDKAIDDYNEAIRIGPDDARSYYGRGYAWAGKKEFEKAITDFDAAIRQDALFFRGLYRSRPRMDR